MKLDFYTYDKTVKELQPIENRTRPPSWWKQMKNSYEVFKSRQGIKVPTPTIKTCPGVADYIRTPITLKLWSDVIFRVKPDGMVEAAEPIPEAKKVRGAIHPRDQYSSEIYKDRAVFKLHGPWAVKASDKTNFMITEVHYSEDLRQHGILLSPGILNFYHQHTLNVFLVFPLKPEEYTVTLKYGTPLMSIYPMTSEKVEVRNHLCTHLEFEEMQDMYPSTFLGRYYSRKHTLRD